MSKNLEIERKFLITVPELDKLNIIKTSNISQTYLNDGAGGSQRRVRKIVCGENVSMTYTEKKFISPVVREENEFEIDSKQYAELLEDAKSASAVKKKRVVFEYMKQNFEMDIYPFSDELAILELELEDIEQKIVFPECINVIKEVSGDRRYSNAVLANAGAFPETQV